MSRIMNQIYKIDKFMTDNYGNDVMYNVSWQYNEVWATVEPYGNYLPKKQKISVTVDNIILPDDIHISQEEIDRIVEYFEQNFSDFTNLTDAIEELERIEQEDKFAETDDERKKKAFKRAMSIVG